MVVSRYQGQPQSIHDKKAKTGVLITNLGTPEAPTSDALRKYLRQFLSDPRVVEIPRLLWLLILHGIILRVRPSKSAALYQKIWTEEGSPLMTISLKQKAKLEKLLTKKYGDDIVVDVAMRYGEPSIGSALAKMQAQGVSNIVVMPLYPQYSGPTTASTFDAVCAELQQWRWIPNLNFVSSYHDQPKYIEALAASITDDFKANGLPEKLILSYHGMPKLFHTNGDPYYCFCMKTTRLVKEKLLADGIELNDDDFITTFQSRFGKAEWLKPYTEDVLTELPEKGITDIAIISPAFSADCLETLDEIEREYREVFEEAGGNAYRYIPALNDRDDHIAAIADILSPYLK